MMLTIILAKQSKDSDSVNITFHELLLDGVLVTWQLAVRHVKTKVSPLIGSCCHPWRPNNTWPVGDCNGVADTKVHSLHDTLTLQFPASSPNGRHGRGSHVAAGTKKLLAMIVMVMISGRHLEGSALFHVLQTSPYGKAGLLRYLQCT